MKIVPEKTLTRKNYKIDAKLQKLFIRQQIKSIRLPSHHNDKLIMTVHL